MTSGRTPFSLYLGGLASVAALAEELDVARRVGTTPRDWDDVIKLQLLIGSTQTSGDGLPHLRHSGGRERRAVCVRKWDVGAATWRVYATETGARRTARRKGLSAMAALIVCTLLLTSTTAPGSVDGAVARARVRVEEMRQDSGVPGVQMAAIVGGTLVWSGGFGWRDLESRSPVTEETRFGIGSVTKTLTMVVCARLVDRGRMAWDEPIETYLEGFPHRGAGITVRRIGSHLSGMADQSFSASSVEEPAEASRSWREVAGAPLVYQPGEAHLYATSPFIVVAAAIETLEDMSFPQVVARELTEPLHLQDTVPDEHHETTPNRTVFYELSDGQPVPVSDRRYVPGGTGYLSTARDLALLGCAVISSDFLSEETRSELLRDHRTNEGQPTFFGLGWRLGYSDEWGLFYASSGGGRGIAACLVVIPKYDVIVATVANMTMAPSWEMTRETVEGLVRAVEETASPGVDD